MIYPHVFSKIHLFIGIVFLKFIDLFTGFSKIKAVMPLLF